MTYENSESAKKAERNSTVIDFYNQCCKSASIQRPWHSLQPMTQIQFTQCVAYINNVIYEGC